MKGPNYSHSSINVVFDIRRFDTNMESGQASMSIVSPAFLAHQSCRGKVHRLHTDLSGAHDNSALRITIRVRGLIAFIALVVSANAIRVLFLRQKCPASFRVHDVEQTNRTCDRPMTRSNPDAMEPLGP